MNDPSDTDPSDSKDPGILADREEPEADGEESDPELLEAPPFPKTASPKELKPTPVAPAVAAEMAKEGKERADRREFLQKAGSVVIGGALVAAPVAVGLRVVAGPLFSSKTGGVLARLTTVDALEPGAPPAAFKVVADKTDAWTTYQDLPLGLVYVRRAADGKVTVFSASCPHAGCAVEYRNSEKAGEHYYCPCHESSFRLDGEIADVATSPAKRGLDTLEIDEEKLAAGEIWIRYQKFKAGVAEKKAIS